MFGGCLYFNLTTLNRQITKVWNDEFALLGLSPSHGYLLMAIAKNPNTSQKYLREIMELDASTITRFVDALEAKNLIQRSGVGKGCELSLTASGRDISTRVKQAASTLRDKMRDTFGEDSFDDVVGKLGQMKEVLDEKDS